MSDNNRLEYDIVANDDTGPATAKAQRNIRSVEEQAAKTAQGMNRGFESQSVSMSAQFEKATAQGIRSLEALERRAALAGKSVLEKLTFQHDNVPKNLGDDPKIITQYQGYYEKLIAARRKYEADMAKMDSGGGHGNLSTMVLRRGFLAVKDFGEGRVQGTTAEVADILFGQGGSGGVVQKVIPQIAELTGLSNGAVIAVGALAGAFAGLSIAGIESMRSLAATGEEIHNFSLRTGIAPTRVQAFQFAATATGQDPAIFERMTRGLAQASEDDSASGTKARKELDQLGVSLYDRFGDLKPTEQIILDLSDGLNKLPPGLERSASSMEIFKRIGVEAIPVLEGLRKNLTTSDEIGHTFSEDDLAMMERWNESLKRMGEEWKRFKLSVEVPLGVVGEITLKGIRLLGIGAGGFDVGGSYATQLGESINSHLFQQGEITPPRADPDALRRIAEKDLADSERTKLLALQRQDPAFRLSEERKKLTEYQALAQHGSVDDVQKAEDQFRLVKGLEQKSGSNTVLEGVIAARKQGFELDAKYAEIQASAEQKRLSASLNTSKELMSPEDINTRLKLAELTAVAQKDKEVEARRKTIDTKTGAEVDLSGTPAFQKFQAAEDATLPKRIRNEYATVLGELEAQDAKYFRARTDADGKAWEQAWERRKKGEMDLQQEEINTRQQIQTHQFDIDASAIDRQKEMALQGLDSVDAQTLQQKIALEDRKLAIEQSYAERSLANQIAKISNEQALAVAEIQKKAADAGVDLNSDSVQGDIAATRDKYQQQIDAARASTGDREILDTQKAQSAKEKLAIESNKRVYDSLKHDAEGLFDQMVFHTKSWGAFAKDIVKAAILTPAKEIFSSQVGGFFTGALTGQKVTFGEVGNGQGAFGKLGSIFGRAGLGQPKFGDQNHPLAKLNAPNHLGDLSLVGGAVPVVIKNAQQGQQTVTNHLSFSSAAAGAAVVGMLLGGGASASTIGVGPPTESVTSKLLGGAIDGTTGGSIDLPSGLGGNLGDSPWARALSDSLGSGASGSIFSLPTPPPFSGADSDGQLFNIAGGTGNLSDSIFTKALSSSLGATSTNKSGGFLGQIGGLLGMGGGGKGGLFGGLKGMFGLDTAGTDMGNGVAIARTGLKGNLAAISKSDGFAMLGGMAALDGIRRGGALGTLEAAGGGAAVGFKYGGPIGAAIGAAIGGGLALAKTFGLFGGDRKHAKDLVKQVYGMDINNATADQIVAIAKQSFGNQIDVAVRSPQVRDLLKLYAQAHGDKKAEDKFVQDTVHSASFSESGGKLLQNAVYDNGNAYSYASSLPTYGGVTTAPLSTYQPNQGVFSGNLSINLNGQSAADVLEGRVTNVVTPGFVQGQALAASSSSNGRTAQQNMTLSPTALTR